MRQAVLFLIALGAAFAGAVGLAEPLLDAASPIQTERLSEQDITRYVENLGSDSEAVAKLAEEGLKKAGSRAVDALQQAAKGNHPKRSARAKRLLAKILTYTHTVLDAMGEPISGGTLEITVNAGEHGRPPGPPIRGGRRGPMRAAREAVPGVIKLFVTPDDRGRVDLGAQQGARLLARFSHPDYGTTQGHINLADPTKQFRLSLVKRGSEAYSRALRGVVSDPEGKPVVGAVIACNEIRTPGQGLINHDQESSAITDDQGRFAFYPVFTARQNDIPALVPKNTRYTFAVTAPSDAGLFPSAGEHANTAEAAVQLERPERFHKFKFEQEEGGFIADEQQLKQIFVGYSKEKGGRSVALSPGWNISGAKLLPGTYRAQLGRLEFLPLEVTAESAEELIFRRPTELTMQGKVINGVTDKPMPRAFVFGISSQSEGTLARLTTEDWKRIRELPAGALPNDPALAVVAKCYGLEAFARTDEEGQYKIVQKPGRDIYGVTAVEEDFLPIQQPKFGMKIEGEIASVPDLPLFPAAKVLIHPVCERQASIMPTWQFEADGQPDWFARFREATDLKLQRTFQHNHWMARNVLQPVYVPADARLKIELGAPYNEEWSAVVAPGVIQLKQGETQTIGELKLTNAISLEVEVVDPQGNPVAEVVVRRRYQDGAGSLPHLTDQKGKTSFYAHQNSRGSFVASLSDKPGTPEANAKNLSVSFEAKAEAVKREPYQIVLTDDQVRTLTANRDKTPRSVAE